MGLRDNMQKPGVPEGYKAQGTNFIEGATFVVRKGKLAEVVGEAPSRKEKTALIKHLKDLGDGKYFVYRLTERVKVMFVTKVVFFGALVNITRARRGKKAPIGIDDSTFVVIPLKPRMKSTSILYLGTIFNLGKTCYLVDTDPESPLFVEAVIATRRDMKKKKDLSALNPTKAETEKKKTAQKGNELVKQFFSMAQAYGHECTPAWGKDGAILKKVMKTLEGSQSRFNIYLEAYMDYGAKVGLPSTQEFAAFVNRFIEAGVHDDRVHRVVLWLNEFGFTLNGVGPVNRILSDYPRDSRAVLGMALKLKKEKFPGMGPNMLMQTYLMIKKEGVNAFRAQHCEKLKHGDTNDSLNSAVYWKMQCGCPFCQNDYQRHLAAFKLGASPDKLSPEELVERLTPLYRDFYAAKDEQSAAKAKAVIETVGRELYDVLGPSAVSYIKAANIRGKNLAENSG